MASRSDNDQDDEEDQTDTGPTGNGPASTKRAVERLDGRERRFSFIAAAASLIFSVTIYIVDTSNKHFRLSKGQLTPQTTLILGIVFAVLIAAATWYGRRAPVGFVVLFTALAFQAYSLVIALPFLGLAGWLLYRSYKIQKESAGVARAARAEATASRTADRGTTKSRAPSGSGRATAATKKGKATGPATPEANKRYTPKRPPPPPIPAPKPSRRQRKAAEAAD